MLTGRVHRRSVEHVTPGRNAMKDLEIERITVYVVGPETDGFQNPVRPGRDGKVTVSGLPGLGVEVDWAAIEAATIYKFEETGRS
jgi:L-alanine-DL-glutamate epimerase-like enolase superfamily enzyme